jgi:hypothetical protein
VVTLIGAAAMIVGAFLDWVSTRSGVDLGISVLWHTNLHTGRYFFTTVGFAAVVLGLLAILGLAPRTGLVTRLAGVLGIVLIVLFVITVYRAPGNFDIGSLSAGPWVVLVGGVIALVGGLIGSRPPAWQAGSGGYAPA